MGDELTHIRTGLKTKKQLGKSLSGEWIKVIGEISPDALGYVKEGDEFDETEVSIYDVLNKISVLGIKIKGPCGHFH